MPNRQVTFLAADVLETSLGLLATTKLLRVRPPFDARLSGVDRHNFGLSKGLDIANRRLTDRTIPRSRAKPCASGMSHFSACDGSYPPHSDPELTRIVLNRHYMHIHLSYMKISCRSADVLAVHPHHKAHEHLGARKKRQYLGQSNLLAPMRRLAPDFINRQLWKASKSLVPAGVA